MKKVILLLSVVLVLASCHGRCPLRSDLGRASLANTTASNYQPVSLRNLIRQFQFDPSAIYGDAFGNKAWH